MKCILARLAKFTFAAVMVTAAAADSWADDWPPSEITMILPHGVGGGQDRQSRVFGAIWAKQLKSQIIFENKEGASGRVGYDYFLNRPDDQVTALSSNMTSASIMYIQQKPGWKWEDSIYQLGVFAVDPGAIFVRNDSPYKTIADLVKAAKETPMTAGVAFFASPDSILLHQITEQTGAKLQIVPIGGGADVVTAVLGGHIQVGYTKVSNIAEIGSDMRVLAVTMEKNFVPELTANAPPLDAALNIKTIPVASYRTINVKKSFAEKYPDRLNYLRESFEAAKKDPEFVSQLDKIGLNPALIVDMSSAELDKMLHVYWDAFDKNGDFLKNK